MTLNKKEVWTTTAFGLPIEIVHWGVEREGFEEMNNGKGVWNYYVYLPEYLLGLEFLPLWLEDKLKKFTPESPERITHDYMSASFNVDEWHGGVTFYDKMGQLPGHRIVKVGCDFNHLWNEERGFDYNLEEVLAEAKDTAKALATLYKIKESK